MNTGTEYKLMLRDSFEEVDDPNGHLKEMLTKAVLNKFWKNGVPNHELILKMDDICLVTQAIICRVKGWHLETRCVVEDNF